MEPAYFQSYANYITKKNNCKNSFEHNFYQADSKNT